MTHRKSIQVLTTSNTQSAAMEQAALTDAFYKFFAVHVDITWGLANNITNSPGCATLYVDDQLSLANCQNQTMGTLLQNYSTNYRITYPTETYPVLFNNWDVVDLAGTHFLGTCMFPANPLANVTYIFEEEIDGELSPHITASNINQKDFYYNNLTGWTLAHELGHAFADLNHVTDHPAEHVHGQDCVMDRPSWQAIIEQAIHPKFCYDFDTNYTNSCRDRLATKFHLRDCPGGP